MNPTKKDSRIFIAIQLENSLQTVLQETQEQLKKSKADVKWVKPQQIHLTLKFLGDISQARITSLKAVLKTTLCDWPDFRFGISHLGAFPKPENPKIICAGIGLGTEHIGKLASIIEENLKSGGFEKEERDFAPHITLGRLKSTNNRFALSKIIKNYAFSQPPSQRAIQVVLYKSTLESSGPVYEALEKFDLKEST